MAKLEDHLHVTFASLHMKFCFYVYVVKIYLHPTLAILVELEALLI